MRSYADHELESTLQHVEGLLSRGKPKAALAEARDITRYVAHELQTRTRFSGTLPSEMQQTLHQIVTRTDAASSAAEIREAIREIRQYAFALSAFIRTQQVEARLRELETQLQAVSHGAIAQGALAAIPAATSHMTDDKGEAVTIESLRSKRVLFTIMPFHPDFEDVWTGGIQRAASGTGLAPIRIDMITKSTVITDDIVNAIEMAEVVVVDVTRNNPNVMFEFGFALALKKPHVVISQATEYLTFDIKHVRTLMYSNSWKGIEVLHRDLQKFIKGAIDSGQQRPTSAHRRTSKRSKP